MRVIAGEHRGRRLDAPRSQKTRPTPDRVREALFSALEVWLGGPGSLDGARTLDLYAGSGALGIEALSRGGDETVFIERDPAALRALEGNLNRLGLEDRARILRGDVQPLLGRLTPAAESFDAALLDPPFASGEIEGALAILVEEGLMRRGGIVVVEFGAGESFTAPSGLVPLRSRVYGSVGLAFFRREDSGGTRHPSHSEDSP
jgi:16S rRNA (guanine(966)-N(2))-methyltransferase RsmD